MTEPEKPTKPPESRICAECGTTIAAGVEECPRCALEAKLGSEGAWEKAAELGSKGFEIDLEALGAELPQLEILEEIGRGGMGVVFKAHQKSLGRDVALKVLPKELDHDTGFSERFLRESRTLAGLSHPHVVAVHDAGQAAGHHYLLMEFVDGTDLAKLMQAGDVQPEQALSIVSQICEALQYAHDKGVVHRDIKPGNILLDRAGEVKLGDFGLAKLAQTDDSMRLTGTLQAMGTPHYMAPEQIERPLEVDHRADLYSLGVVLYELLTGELPIGRFQVPSKKADIDVRLDEVVMKTLEKEPELRYQSASEVRMEVQRASDAARGDGRGRPRNVSAAGALDRSSKKGAKPYLGCGLLILSAVGLLWAFGASLWTASKFAQGEGGLVHMGNLVLSVTLAVLLSVGMGVAGLWMRRSDQRRREEGASQRRGAHQEERVSTASYIAQEAGEGESDEEPVTPPQTESAGAGSSEESERLHRGCGCLTLLGILMLGLAGSLLWGGIQEWTFGDVLGNLRYALANPEHAYGVFVHLHGPLIPLQIALFIVAEILLFRRAVRHPLKAQRVVAWALLITIAIICPAFLAKSLWLTI